MTTELLVLSDTHLIPGQLDHLPDQVWDAASRADTILHAGDVMCDELLDALAARARLHAVPGNNDVKQMNDLGAGRLEALPDQLVLTIEGVELAMLHDSGPRSGRENRMQRRFPSADLVVFGHSHEPISIHTEHEQTLFNPGSPTQRRRQPRATYGWITLDLGRIEAQIIEL